ncbi:MAG: LysM peptidoglycan-binding domain-containing protein [Oscillospiraceae bacterium]
MIIYEINKGDTIYGIAQKFGVPVEAILAANEGINPNWLVSGQAIVIPGNFFQHTVQRGESMYTIARDYGISLNTLIDANPQIRNPARIQIGQKIIIPKAPPKLGTINVNGYVYPGVKSDVLQKTLPHLTYISIFSYMVSPDGSLNDINDTAIIQAARQAGVAPVMVITNMEEGAGFSSKVAHDILTNDQIQTTLINNIIAVMQQKDYYGLNVDFEYLYPEDRQNYNDFISKVVNALRPLGYEVLVALAPKLSGDQRGLLYEAHDYEAIGALVDHVILMTYEWGYLYGPAMAVAPENQVRKVLDYATTVIPSEKILMGMPNYGYDWTLPFVRGTSARLLTNNGAVALAVRVGADIQFDPVAQAPFFNYYDSSGKQHEVWFDDARSIYARLLLVSLYDLGGVSYWTVSNYYSPNWVVLESMYTVRKVL